MGNTGILKNHTVGLVIRNVCVVVHFVSQKDMKHRVGATREQLILA